MRTHSPTNAPGTSIRTILEALPDPVFIHDERLNIVDCSIPNTGEFAPLRAHILGSTLDKILPAHLAERLTEALCTTAREKTVISVDFDLEHQDTWRSYTAHMTPYGHGGVLSVVRDVTEPRELKQRVELLQQAVAASDKVKSEFLSMMSHELRSPLNGILGMIQLLKSRATDHESLEYLDIAETAGFSLTRILGDILELAASADQPAEDAVFALDQLVAEVLALFQATARNKNIRLDCTHCALEHTQLCTDVHKIRQIVFALVSNAVKFTAEGSVRVVCALAPDVFLKNKALLTVTVIDTGIGIAPEDHARIFEIFSQVDQSINRKYSGAGIGLALAKKLAERLGGSISVHSVPGQGAEFQLSVPVRHATASQKTIHAAPHPDCGDMYILYAEDEKINQIAMQAQLRRYGVRIRCADNGGQAIQALREEHFDAVLLDINMPDIDGIDVLRAILNGDLRTPPETPVFAVTAHADEKSRANFLRLGFTEFFAKPVVYAAVYCALAAHWPARAHHPQTNARTDACQATKL